MGRHWQNITAHHVLTLLDACYSGLSQPRFRYLSDIDERKHSRFKSLTLIEAETKERARNLLVSGTANQASLCQAGGIFTEALVAGLRGDGDWNKDGIIELEELFLEVRRRVVEKATALSQNQKPALWSDTMAGSGSVIFFKETTNSIN